MGVFQSIFGNNKEEITEYLAGSEVILDGEDHCRSFIETQLTTKETAENAFAHIKLSYGKDKTLECAVMKDQDGNREELIIKKNFKHRPLRTNEIYNFVRSKDGRNYLGGHVPQDFQIPENSCPSSFQYLGKLSKDSPGLKWLPHDLHLICPVYMDIDQIWLDYSEPNTPSIINLDAVNNLTTAYDDLKEDSFIEFQKVHFSTTRSTEYGFNLGHTGVPNWIQDSEIPRCPKTKRTMRFLCQLHGGVDVSRTNIEAKDKWFNQYFSGMNFWGDGDLYVFFEPESKIACYIIQNT